MKEYAYTSKELKPILLKCWNPFETKDWMMIRVRTVIEDAIRLNMSLEDSLQVMINIEEMGLEEMGIEFKQAK